MNEELIQFTINYATEQGIPAELLSAVVERVRAGKQAVDTVDQWCPLIEMQPASSIIVVNTLEDLEKEIATANKVLAKRVIDRAVKDHQKGILERRCE